MTLSFTLMIIPCYKFVRVTLSFMCPETCISHLLTAIARSLTRYEWRFANKNRTGRQCYLFQLNYANFRKEGQILSSILRHLQKHEMNITRPCLNHSGFLALRFSLLTNG